MDCVGSEAVVFMVAHDQSCIPLLLWVNEVSGVP